MGSGLRRRPRHRRRGAASALRPSPAVQGLRARCGWDRGLALAEHARPHHPGATAPRLTDAGVTDRPNVVAIGDVARARDRRAPGGGRGVHPRSRQPRQPGAGAVGPVQRPVLEAPLWNRTARPTASSPAATYCASRIELRVCSTPGHPRLVLPLRPRTGHRVHPRSPCPRAAPGATGADLTPRSTRSSSRSAAPCSPCPPTPPSAPGHGDSTTIGTEAAHLEDWLTRRHDAMLD
jgi:hypothetical protein